MVFDRATLEDPSRETGGTGHSQRWDIETLNFSLQEIASEPPVSKLASGNVREVGDLNKRKKTEGGKN